MSKKCVFGLSENLAAALSYSIIWFTGIVFLVLERDNKTVRFHAMQSVMLFLPLSILQWFLRILPFFGHMLAGIVGFVGFVAWAYLIYQAYKGTDFRLPIIGDIVWEQIHK